MTNQQQTTTLQLPRPVVNKILAHAQQNDNQEVCGLIGNDSSGNMDYYTVDNIADKPAIHFLMDASQQIGAMKKMREKEQTLLAIVHSHPTSAAIPSDFDIEENNYEAAYYIIVSLSTEGVLEMRAYLQHGEGMQEVELILEDKD